MSLENEEDLTKFALPPRRSSALPEPTVKKLMMRTAERFDALAVELIQVLNRLATAVEGVVTK